MTAALWRTTYSRTDWMPMRYFSNVISDCHFFRTSHQLYLLIHPNILIISLLIIICLMLHSGEGSWIIKLFGFKPVISRLLPNTRPPKCHLIIFYKHNLLYSFHSFFFFNLNSIFYSLLIKHFFLPLWNGKCCLWLLHTQKLRQDNFQKYA